jgi:hypothetical protein
VRRRWKARRGTCRLRVAIGVVDLRPGLSREDLFIATLMVASAGPRPRSDARRPAATQHDEVSTTPRGQVTLTQDGPPQAAVAIAANSGNGRSTASTFQLYAAVHRLLDLRGGLQSGGVRWGQVGRRPPSPGSHSSMKADDRPRGCCGRRWPACRRWNNIAQAQQDRASQAATANITPPEPAAPIVMKSPQATGSTTRPTSSRGEEHQSCSARLINR